MTIFEAVKSKITPRMAVERYGLQVSRNGMVRCPFHDDTNPSMKLYDDRYHYFGFQETGSVWPRSSLALQTRKRRRNWQRTSEPKKKRHLCWQNSTVFRCRLNRKDCAFGCCGAIFIYRRQLPTFP